MSPATITATTADATAETEEGIDLPTRYHASSFYGAQSADFDLPSEPASPSHSTTPVDLSASQLKVRLPRAADGTFQGLTLQGSRIVCVSGAAAESGMRAGDRVVEVDGSALHQLDWIHPGVQRTRRAPAQIVAGEEVELLIERKSSTGALGRQPSAGALGRQPSVSAIFRQCSTSATAGQPTADAGTRGALGPAASPPARSGTVRWSSRWSRASSSASLSMVGLETSGGGGAADEPKAKQGDPLRAHAANLMRRCIKKRVAADGPFVDPTGVRVDVQRADSVQWLSLHRLAEFSCPAAVTLLLQLLLEGGAIFSLMALVATPATADAILRNLNRKRCRELFSDGAPLPALNGTLSACGYASASLRRNFPGTGALGSAHLLAAIGSCVEYAHDPERPNQTAPQVVASSSFEPFVELGANSAFCLGGGSGLGNQGNFSSAALFWAVCVNVILFALLLLRVRRFEVQRGGGVGWAVVSKGAVGACDDPHPPAHASAPHKRMPIRARIRTQSMRLAHPQGRLFTRGHMCSWLVVVRRDQS